MKPLTIATTLLACGSIALAEKPTAEHLSLRLEIERAINTGNKFLLSQQKEDGSWGDPNIPAFTALALTALANTPDRDHAAPLPANIDKGYDWLLKQQKGDGGIYGKGLASYNSASSLMALVARGRKEDEAALLKVRRFLVNQQTDWDQRGEADNNMDGGVGYGGSYAHSDLSNTYLALEALYHSRALANDTELGKQPQLDWEAALKFISRCQNLEETNDEEWASNDPDNKGGFIYFPGSSKAGETELGDGRVALRSYGSMSYAGLLSLIYADVKKDDERVTSVLDWLGKNYTLEENPGLGAQGQYYYYQVLTKALSAAGIRELTLGDGTKVDWRRDLGSLLVSSQREDGSWINENSRWWENDPILVTADVVLTLEQLHATLPVE